MTCRDHMNLALGTYCAASWGTPPNYWGLFFLLFGCSFPDMDKKFIKGAKHRASLVHTLWTPLFLLLLFFSPLTSVLFGAVPVLYVRAAGWFAIGWALHLAGDFIQGGVGVGGGRVWGFRRFNWDRYSRGFMGYGLSFVLCAAGIASVAFIYRDGAKGNLLWAAMGGALYVWSVTKNSSPSTFWLAVKILAIYAVVKYAV